MRRDRGMTLLEVLIATTILASLTVIVATLWAQTRQWTEETRTHDTALRLQRALDLLDAQWSGRLTNATLPTGEPGAAVVDGDRLEFTTTESALFPGWPLVRAAYTAVGESPLPGAPVEWRLVYEETRLGTTSDPDFSSEDPKVDPVNRRTESLATLTGRPRWSAALSDAQLTEWESAHGVSAGESRPQGARRWIDLTDGADSAWVGVERAVNPDAVRLDGETREGGFRWALVGRPLR
ncbi:MAG: prepilin-type N-terminal cleavage/methylation domain-containing protein [Phycisphaeraceae bacterium]|nr:prepilin-type N-terminal cleavage/methylation domain-containing protein [Phycisphaeraceae bacterium]MCB9847942.1 prepilin-type N-terminal cleavage/methylation domain-containing protein [Phycisphaeraceae bacterium]